MTITLKLNILGYRIATIDLDLLDDHQVTYRQDPPKPLERAASKWAKWVSRKWVEKMVS